MDPPRFICEILDVETEAKPITQLALLLHTGSDHNLLVGCIKRCAGVDTPRYLTQYLVLLRDGL